MGLSIHVPKFLKGSFAHKVQDNSKLETTSPNGSIYDGVETTTTASSSPAPSIMASKGYIRDPTRCGNQPSVLGQFYDPMGGKFTLIQGKDATFTGA